MSKRKELSIDTSWFRKGGSKGYTTTRLIEWRIGKKNSGWVLTIPYGFEFKHSIPWVMRWMFSKTAPIYLKASCVRAALLDQGFTEAFANSQWHEVALSEHAPKFRTGIAYKIMRD